jgi:hypothetical protein
MPARTSWLSAAALLLTVSVSACGSCSGSSAGGDGGDPHALAAVSLTRACTAFAKAACGRLFGCTPFAGALAYGDAATCEQRLVLACVPAPGAPGSTLTATQVDQCADAVTGETCEQYLDNDQPSACAYTGSLPEGAACGTDAQCLTGYCRLAPLTSCGTCAKRWQAGQAGPDGGLGCTSNADCVATLICAATGASTGCTVPAAAGAACGLLQPCQGTLACIGGKCAAPVPLGGSCAAPTDCDGAHGAGCDVTTKKCIPIGTASAGQACGVSSSALVECSGGATCSTIGSPTLGQGTCHPPATDNAPCGPGIGCLAPAICAPSTLRCTLPNPSLCH